jgi:rod shape-determining protein MreC
VFGQVARVEELTSEVILMSDPAHAIPVQINRNGLRTIAVGTGDTSRLKLPYLPTSADVVAGDLLVTSGLGGGFPAGYPVGTVATVKRDPAQSLAEVDIRPAAALDRSRELLFVWMKPGAAQPGAGAALAPGATATPASGAGAAPAPATAAHSTAAHAATAAKTPPAKPGRDKPP